MDFELPVVSSTDAPELNSPVNPGVSNRSFQENRDRKIYFIIGALTLFIAIVGSTVIYAFNRPKDSVDKTKNINKPLISNTSLITTFQSLTPTPRRYSYSVDLSEAIISTEQASLKSNYQIKRTDISTGKSEIIYEIPFVLQGGGKSQIFYLGGHFMDVGFKTGFVQTNIDSFLFSDDQRLIAYRSQEMETVSGSDEGNVIIHYTIHIFNTDTIQDKIIYKKTADFAKAALDPEQKTLDCSNPTTQQMIDKCFDKMEPFFDHAQILFTKDNKRLILGGSVNIARSPGYGLFALDTDKYQDKLEILSKNQIRKMPQLSPSGKYLLAEFNPYRFNEANEANIDGVIDQLSTEINFNIFDLTANKIYYNLHIGAKSDSEQTQPFHVWKPSFISDQAIFIPTEKQLIVVNTQSKNITDITTDALKDLTDKKIITSFAFYHQKTGKIIYQVNDSISYSPQGICFSINPDGSGREKLNSCEGF